MISCFAILVSIIFSRADGLQYKGCYVAPLTQNLFNMPLLYGKQLSQTLIPQLCHDHCLKYNMPWAVLQAGDRCWCSNALSPDSKVEDNECNQTCAGDNTLACGSNDRLTVYEVDEITNFVGCYVDAENRTMPDNKMTQMSAMNPDICLAHCRNRNARFAGLETGSECWCSNEQPVNLYRAAHSEECNYECSGDASRICGGDWRLSVFKVDERARYVGCYENLYSTLPSEEQLQRVSNILYMLTPQACISYCREIKSPIAGFSGRNCWCLNKIPSYIHLANETSCDVSCNTGDLKCGPESHIEIYELLDIAPYAGCYKDGGSPSTRQLPYDIAYWEADLTPEICIVHCRNRGMNFAGMHLAKQCFCGEKLPLSKAPEEHCSMNCPGDSSRNCGGDWRLSVYNLRVRDDISEYYMGCFKESGEENKQWKLHWNFPKHLTPELCLGHCYRNNFSIAAVRDGDECRCANEIVVTTRVSDSECYLSCPGDRNAKCGHLFRTNVYQTNRNGMAVSMMNSNYLGCFKYPDVSDILYRTSLSNLTGENCIDFCVKQGFELAALHNGVNCTCLDSLKRTDKTSEAECSFQCSGDPQRKCGSVTALSTYKTGLIDIKDEESNRVGCFMAATDAGLHLLPLAKFDLIKNSPQRCLSLCFHLGFKYSGVENRIECHCGNEKPQLWAALTEYDCWEFQCPGDIGKDCGGKKKILVHSTGLESDHVEAALSIPVKPAECVRSVTTVNGKQACKEEIIFEEDFKHNSDLSSRWLKQNYMPTDPDHEFVMFTDKPENCYTRNGNLVLKPLLLNDELVRGKVSIDGCTGQAGTLECEREAFAFRINPPIASARLASKFSFRYGRIDITAKLPSGDWIWPELRLVTVGRNQTDFIKLAFIRGNGRLTKDHIEIGNTFLEAGIASSGEEGVTQKIVRWTQGRPWSSDPHIFSTIWTPSKISFLVDNKRIQSISLQNIQASDPAENVDISFLNEELSLLVGVSVGGVTEFPDGITGSSRKPWQNQRLKALSQFYQARNMWLKSWTDEDSPLYIYRIAITAL